MEKNSLVGLFIGGFITIIVGILLAQQLGNSVQAGIVPPVVNESVTMAAGTGTLAQIPLLIATSIENTTNKSSTFGTHTNVTLATGAIVSSEYMVGTYHVVYTYVGNQYMQDKTSRNFYPMYLLFFVVAIFAVAATLAYKQFPEMFK